MDSKDAASPAANDINEAFALMFAEQKQKSVSISISIDIAPETSAPTLDEATRAEYQRFKASKNEKERAEMADKLAKHAKLLQREVEPLAIAGRMYLELEKPQVAVELLKLAHELAKHRSDVLADLRIANARINSQRIRSSPRAQQLSEDLMHLADHDERKEILELKKRDQRGVVWATLLSVVLIAGLYFGSVELELGDDPRGFFFWCRIGALLTFAASGIFGLMRHRPLRASDFAITAKPLFAVVALGAVFGGLTPIAASDVAAPLAFVAALIEVIAIELFFRAYLGRALHRGSAGAILPAILGGALFAAFQLSHADSFHQLVELKRGVTTAGLALVWGISLASVHKKTGSMMLATVGHWTARAILLIAALP